MENKSEKTVLQRMADLIAYAEISSESPTSTHSSFTTLLEKKTSQIEQQFRQLSNNIQHLRDIMSHSGAQKLREESEQLSQQSKQEIRVLESIYRETKTVIGAQCVQLNKASMTTVKHVSQLVSTARKNHLKKVTGENLAKLQKNYDINRQTLQRAVKSLHWKNVIMAVMLTLVTASVVSLYVDNAWPWEAHHQILKQREAGKILLRLWPQLSPKDQAIIVQNA